MSQGDLAAGSTGDSGVDALVAQAARTVNIPASEHKEHYTQILAALERELDADPGAAPQGAVLPIAPTSAAQNQGATS